ncbi:SPRY domain-containing SOCS box protein 4 [Sarcoptes scabiei]|uniref:SPRY domain-containing SOCS box protein 4 n=2 Tax=Sarcoptes scabiei TaxID=52283 RepID=A0A834R6R7_SARSC|nr:SPRY domain-containing SOCS box protein 4 [Sarcoptes scabiei]UXI20897.1 3-hydroxyacyl-CoA dehydrogenase type-2 [Sarcoptes scabiei]
MLRIIENWPSLRSLANMDLQSLVRSLRSQDKKSVQNLRADCHAERPARLDRLLEEEELPEDIQVENGWSMERKSPNVNILQNGLVGKRRPIAKSTDCMFGRMGYTSGLHVWTIQWPVECRGTHAVVGVATESMQFLHTSGYCSLVGSDSESFGWDIVRSRFFHNKKETIYPVWLSSHDKFTIPDEFTVVLDMDEGTLGFIVDGLYIGIAYAGLSGKKLYPVISTVWGNVEIGIRYTNFMPPGPLLLRECCRKTIRQHSGKKRIRKLANEARLPLVLKQYLLN